MFCNSSSLKVGDERGKEREKERERKRESAMLAFVVPLKTRGAFIVTVVTMRVRAYCEEMISSWGKKSSLCNARCVYARKE